MGYLAKITRIELCVQKIHQIRQRLVLTGVFLLSGAEFPAGSASTPDADLFHSQ